MANYVHRCIKCGEEQTFSQKMKMRCAECGGKVKVKEVVSEKPKEKKEKKELVITEEIAEKVLFLDCREEDNIRRLKKSLMKLPFVKKAFEENGDETFSTDRLEEFIKKIERKKGIHLAYIMRSVVDCEDIYSGMIKTDAGDVKGNWIKTIHGQTLWEVCAKVLFYMYYYIEHKGKRAGGKTKAKSKNA